MKISNVLKIIWPSVMLFSIFSIFVILLKYKISSQIMDIFNSVV